MGNHLMNSTSLAKLRALSLVSATLEIEYAPQREREREREREILEDLTPKIEMIIGEHFVRLVPS